MREIVFDTETTGLNPRGGDRVVEIGAVELVGHLPTGREFHAYINPERDMPQGSFAVHGLSAAFLSRYPTFEQTAAGFLEFIGDDARLVAHNAGFDHAFLDAELTRCGLPPLNPARILDTLALARRKHPGSPTSLDALCRRYALDLSVRDKHGALVDARLLAHVYLELIGGHQPAFALGAVHVETSIIAGSVGALLAPPIVVSLPTAEETAAHAAFIAELGAMPGWLHYAESRKAA